MKSTRVYHIVRQIETLTVVELAELREVLADRWNDEGGSAGVREPVPTRPPDGSAQASP